MCAGHVLGRADEEVVEAFVRRKIACKSRRAPRVGRVTRPCLSPSARNVGLARENAAAAMPTAPRCCPLSEKFAARVGPQRSAAITKTISVETTPHTGAASTLTGLYAARHRHGKT